MSNPDRPLMRDGLIFGLFPVAVILGLAAPDLDQPLKFVLHHRSILTHSALLVLALLWLVPNRFTRAALAWFSFGIAIHLIADLFPSRWIGYALIYLPILKTSIGAPLSILWILGNAILAFWIAEWLLRSEHLHVRFAHYAAGGVAAAFYAAFHEGNIVVTIPTLVAWSVIAVLMHYVARNRRPPFVPEEFKLVPLLTLGPSVKTPPETPTEQQRPDNQSRT